MVLKYNFSWSGQLQVCENMKYKCFKSECPVCHTTGSIQLFINNKGEIRYARTRHYSINKDSKKQQFTYCKIKDKEALKTLSNKPITLSTSTTPGQVGQAVNVDLQKREYSSKELVAGGKGFEPLTLSLEG